ncbi:hypothetical protein [Mucilaginibacter sp. UYCu711]|uniref:hypothetical protein n=1 Tax=Mucilaginibacter sp. UYCu711 TaxID=3156339 RepID=UPI003D1E6FDD
MKTVTNNKKRFLALIIAFTLVLTVAMQIIVKAQDLGDPCVEYPLAAQNHYEADPAVDVTCKDCSVNTSTPIKNNQGDIIGYHYTVKTNNNTLKKHTCHSTTANKTCGESSIIGGVQSCISEFDFYIDDTGTGASTGTGSH